MLKKICCLTTFLLLFSFNSLADVPKAKNPVQDPNIVHIKIPPEPKYGKPKGLPAWNEFDKKDLMIINRHTNTFYIFEIADGVYENFEKESNFMSINGVKEITIDLHSPGGALVIAKMIQEQIKILQSQGIKVHTIIQSKNACMSACPLIFLAGNTRTAYDDSVIMFHAPYVDYPYNVSGPEVVVTEKELKIARLDFIQYIEPFCKKDKMIGMDFIDHKSHYYTVEQLENKCGKESKFFTEVIVTPKENVVEITPFEILQAIISVK